MLSDLPIPVVPSPSPSPPARPSSERSESSPTPLEAKWGKPLIDAGYTALPAIIIDRQAALGLDAVDMNILLHLVRHWFEASDLPWPSKGSIANAMQVTPRTIQKRLAKLEQHGLIKRIERRGPKGSLTSQYDLRGLIDAATPYAKEALEEREAKRRLTRERLGRKRPRLASARGEK